MKSVGKTLYGASSRH